MNIKNNEKINITSIIEIEVQRLTSKYDKEFFDCNDLIGVLGVGRDNVRSLMRSENFPTIIIGNRKVVSILSFIIWQIEKDNLTYGSRRVNM